MNAEVNLNSLTEWATSPLGFYVNDRKRVNGRPVAGPVMLTDNQERILRHVFTKAPDGRFPYETVVWSAPKKNGKTLIGAVVGLWFALTQEPPNEIYVIANDFEQAQARVFQKIQYAIRKNPAISLVKLTNKEIVFERSGTKIVAIASDYASAAGSNHGLTLWDELWAYTSTRSQRLWDELTPVPTRTNSVRFISTYAGFEGQSDTLWELYVRGVSKDEHPSGQGEKIPELEDLPCYRNGNLFTYWDHELHTHPGLGQTPAEYHENQRSTLRASAFLRLHENRWATDEETFIDSGKWDACVNGVKPLVSDTEKAVWLHVDASVKRDSSAVVGTYYDRDTQSVILACHRIWEPSVDEPLDLEETIEAYLLDCVKRMRVSGVSYDPFQFHRSAVTLRKRNLPMVEFPQTEPNLTAASQQLYELLEFKNLQMYPSETLRKQALAAVAIEKKRGWRIAKQNTRRHVDSIVALAASALHTVRNNAYSIGTPLKFTTNFADDGSVLSAVQMPEPFMEKI